MELWENNHGIVCLLRVRSFLTYAELSGSFNCKTEVLTMIQLSCDQRCIHVPSWQPFRFLDVLRPALGSRMSFGTNANERHRQELLRCLLTATLGLEVGTTRPWNPAPFLFKTRPWNRVHKKMQDTDNSPTIYHTVQCPLENGPIIIKTAQFF